MVLCCEIEVCYFIVHECLHIVFIHLSFFKNVRFTREYLGELLSEDSCHYLIYSLIFLYNSFPLTGILF